MSAPPAAYGFGRGSDSSRSRHGPGQTFLARDRVMRAPRSTQSGSRKHRNRRGAPRLHSQRQRPIRFQGRLPTTCARSSIRRRTRPDVQYLQTGSGRLAQARRSSTAQTAHSAVTPGLRLPELENDPASTDRRISPVRAKRRRRRRRCDRPLRACIRYGIADIDDVRPDHHPTWPSQSGFDAANTAGPSNGFRLPKQFPIRRQGSSGNLDRSYAFSTYLRVTASSARRPRASAEDLSRSSAALRQGGAIAVVHHKS